MFLRGLTKYGSMASVASFVSLAAVSSCDAAPETPSNPVAFSPKEFRAFPIKQIQTMSPDTKRFVLALPTEDHVMGTTVSSLVQIRHPTALDKDGKEIARPYTPISLNEDKGRCELLIKTYPDGVVSSYLDSLAIGDSIEVKGPFNKLKYTPNMKKKIGMVAGGTGITPMMQVIREILKNPDDKTEIFLVFTNHSGEDLLLGNEIAKLAAHHPGRLHYNFFFSKPNTPRQQHINAEYLKSLLPPPSSSTLVYVCGPPGLLKAVAGEKGPNYTQGQVDGYLKELGYTTDMVYKF